MTRLNAYVEHHPLTTSVASVFSITVGIAQWFTDHADAFTKLTGFAAALLGCAAGWYAFRINRRNWKKAQAEDASE